MGWYFRKSKSFGPFRFTLSNAGLGMSFGVKGARISFSKRGTYVNLGANGIYYRERIDGRKSRGSNNYSDSGNRDSQNYAYTNTETFVDSDSTGFVNQMRTTSKMISFFKIFGLLPCAIACIWFSIFVDKQVSAKEVFFDVLTIEKNKVNIRQQPDQSSASLGTVRKGNQFEIIGRTDNWLKIRTKDSVTGFVRSDMGTEARLIKRHMYERRIDREPYWKNVGYLLIASSIAWCLYLWRWDRDRKLIKLDYTMDGELKTLHEKFLRYFGEFKSSSRIWENISSSLADKKRNAGASTLVNRKTVYGIASHNLPVNHLITNVSIPTISCRAGELYFFPERVVLKHGNQFSACMYRNITTSMKETLFIEEEGIAGDARIHSYTWRYLNRDGTPDMRFSNNKRLPVCIYSEYSLSMNGTEISLTTSKPGAMDNFLKFIAVIGEYQKRMN